jgi:hypothetical protein
MRPHHLFDRVIGSAPIELFERRTERLARDALA